MSKLDHILAAMWTSTSGNDAWIDKTPTWCTVDQPIIVAAVASHTDNGVWVVHVRVKSGATMGVSPNSRGWGLGVTTQTNREGGALSTVIIPTATSVTFQFYDMDTDETIYVYKT